MYACINLWMEIYIQFVYTYLFSVYILHIYLVFAVYDFNNFSLKASQTFRNQVLSCIDTWLYCSFYIITNLVETGLHLSSGIYGFD